MQQRIPKNETIAEMNAKKFADPFHLIRYDALPENEIRSKDSVLPLTLPQR